VDPLAVLNEPSTQVERSAEDMLADLERLVDAVQLKLVTASDVVRARFEHMLAPKLAEVRRLVSQRSPLAKNAVEDAIVLLRETATVAPAAGVGA
jgi:hypothetical protein